MVERWIASKGSILLLREDLRGGEVREMVVEN